MSRYLDRLRKGERCWADEIALRATGVTLLTGCYHAALLAYRMGAAHPSSQSGVGEFAICAWTFLLLSSGLALTIEGPGLFRDVPIPRSSAYFLRSRTDD